MRSRQTVLGLAVLAAMPAIAGAGIVSWNYNGGTATSNSWAAASSWNPVSPAFDGTEDIVLNSSVLTANRTLTLDGNYLVNSLTGISGTSYKFTVNPGSAPSSTIQIKTGNLTLNGNGVSYGRPIALTNSTIQIGDGVTPVTTAVWDLNNSHGNKNPMEIGSIKGMAGTLITLQGNNRFITAGSSPNFFGTFKITQSALKEEINASNAVGGVGSTLEAAGSVSTFLNFNSVAGVTSTTHDMNISVTSPKLAIAVAPSTGGSTSSVAAINGNITGAAALDLGSLPGDSGLYKGILRVNGSANTLSGDVKVYAGTLRVDGTWTGAGNVAITHIYTSGGSPIVLSGAGSLTTQANKIISLRGNDHVNGTFNGSNAELAIGTDGTVGTMKLATSGTGKVFFDDRSYLKIDVGGGQADLLDITGNLDLANLNTLVTSKFNALAFNELSTLTLPSYTIASYTGSLTGTFDKVLWGGTDVTAAITSVGGYNGYTLQYNTGAIQLVAIPEPGSAMALLGTGAMLAIRRRRKV